MDRDRGSRYERGRSNSRQRDRRGGRERRDSRSYSRSRSRSRSRDRIDRGGSGRDRDRSDYRSGEGRRWQRGGDGRDKERDYGNGDRSTATSFKDFIPKVVGKLETNGIGLTNTSSSSSSSHSHQGKNSSKNHDRASMPTSHSSLSKHRLEEGEADDDEEYLGGKSRWGADKFLCIDEADKDSGKKDKEVKEGKGGGGGGEEGEEEGDFDEEDFGIKDEEEEARKLIEERRKRREEILLKHQQQATAKSDSDTAAISTTTASQPTSEPKPESNKSKENISLNETRDSNSNHAIDVKNAGNKYDMYDTLLEDYATYPTSSLKESNKTTANLNLNAIALGHYPAVVASAGIAAMVIDDATEDVVTEKKKHRPDPSSSSTLSLKAPTSPNTTTATTEVTTAPLELANSLDDEAVQLEVERLAVEEINAKSGGLVFDMFSSSPSLLERARPASASKGGWLPGVLGGAMGRQVQRAQLLAEEDPHLQSNWDDGEGYYKARIGEVIADRYHILGVVGKGVFSTVLKCIDMRKRKQVEDDAAATVAIKLIRSNDTMRKASDKEKSILLEILQRDPENKKHCVRLLSSMDYRGHVALVFEYQQMNLREALKKFGKDVGINITAVRIYARQLLLALKHLSDLRIVHADIKLDNILCSGDLKTVKICDFGSAFRETDTDNDPTPYLVSRFYRAPEIILGLPYDRAIDLWSIAVCLFELFTGHVMFPGRTNNEMLRLQMTLKGKPSNKIIKAHQRSYEILNMEPFYDADFRFKQVELDPISGKTNIRLVDMLVPTKNLLTIIKSCKAGGDDANLVQNLADLIDKCISIDPAKRATVMEALRHQFFAISTKT